MATYWWRERLLYREDLIDPSTSSYVNNHDAPVECRGLPEDGGTPDIRLNSG
jgi:hypothetical protein